MLVWLGENKEAVSLRYGNISTASVGAIQRQLLSFESQGADEFFAGYQRYETWPKAATRERMLEARRLKAVGRLIGI